MKISLNTLGELSREFHSENNVLAADTTTLLSKIGSQLGGIDEVISLGDKYQGAVIVRVVECVPHPNADRLKVCLIDDGGVVQDVPRKQDNLVEVVCGAPNVAAGQLVIWLPPGVTVPETFDKDPFVLEARELRGIVSNGMLASPKELALGDSHEGLLLLDGDYQPGTAFADAFGLNNDVIVDIENKMFTHRPDCFGWLGVSRELAGIQHLPYHSPDWFVAGPVTPEVQETLPLNIVNELPELVPRFTAITMQNVTIGPSPAWLQIRLSKIGLRPISNVVDITNYLMALTGQPLHAFDYDKVKAASGDSATIVVRNPKPGEKVELLNGKTIEPRSEAIMIATDQKLLGVGGVMGGSETEVDSGTKNIIIECANFDMYSVRRTIMAHGLFTDAATRFTKGQSPLQNVAALLQMVQMVQQLASGELAGNVIDVNHLPEAVMQRQSVHPEISLPVAFINTRLGLQLSAEETAVLLRNVEFDVVVENETLTVKAPFWRTDIELREDVVEEVGRLYGYDHLPLELPIRDASPTVKDPMLTQKAALRHRLAKAGANEVLTYSFVHGDLLRKAGQDSKKAFKVSNALSPDLQYYRISLMPSLLDKIHPNIKAGYDEFAVFELGKVHDVDHVDEEGLPLEFDYLGLVVAANEKLKKGAAAYYQAKLYLEMLVGQDNVVYKPVEGAMADFPVVRPYQVDRSAFAYLKDGTFLGVIGEFRAEVRHNLKLPRFAAGFEVDATVAGPALQSLKEYQPLSRFPSVKQDITLRLPANVAFADLQTILDEQIAAAAPRDSYYQLQPTDIFEPADNKDVKHVTLRLTISNHMRTLTDSEVNNLLDTVAEHARESLNAERL